MMVFTVYARLHLKTPEWFSTLAAEFCAREVQSHMDWDYIYAIFTEYNHAHSFFAVLVMNEQQETTVCSGSEPYIEDLLRED